MFNNLFENFSYSKTNDVLSCFAQLITNRGYISIDGGDFKYIAASASSLTFGVGIAAGENRATNATKIALQNAFLTDKTFDLQGILISITASSRASFDLDEYDQITNLINDIVVDDKEGKGAFIKIGIMFDEKIDDNLKIFVIAARNNK